ncbi:hypothetical protein M8542_39410 [Amycolatopsis sp. OK19-0408]|uniref:Uncharacterized protein n=1 Tax=Amycolatopsis iheyensis TaxID=2945988 RepID=A0A9X2NLD6_9PSEU|nr:hypothetical protein [Amycolatopsis iheyensis]MCR6488915.1 hypothetical protein [Amycolatopsis iheyensis]
MTSDEVRISAQDDPDELRALIKWLRAEDDLRSRLTLHDKTPGQGHMGGALDYLTLLLGGGFGTVFVKSLFTYLGQRRKSVVFDLELERGDGQRLRLRLTNDKSAEATLETVIRFIDARE